MLHDTVISFVLTALQPYGCALIVIDMCFLFLRIPSVMQACYVCLIDCIQGQVPYIGAN